VDAPTLSSTFPNLYGQPLVDFAPSSASLTGKALRIGVIFCGRQAPGGHNVISGLFDHVTSLNPDSRVIGFVGGTLGFFEGNYVELTAELVSLYRNQGGYDLLGRTVDKIYGAAHLTAAKTVCLDLALDGLVLIGSHGTASYASYLSEYLAQQGVSTRVVVAPGSIDGDMKNQVLAVFPLTPPCTGDAVFPCSLLRRPLGSTLLARCLLPHTPPAT
jgi:pyrophosphate--fructose-6-phosphate 1-phosphotransferase